MKPIEEMTLEELKEERDSIRPGYFIVGSAYKMQRALSINKRIEELESEKQLKLERKVKPNEFKS